MVKKILTEVIVPEPVTEDEIIEDVDLIEKQPVVTAKPKRVLTEKQKAATAANLAKGRAALKLRQEEQREFSKKAAEDLVIQKANFILKAQKSKVSKIKNILDIQPQDETETEVEIEERIIKKPRKKRIVYREESETDQEVIIKSRRPRREVEQPLPAPSTPAPSRQVLNFI